MKVKIATSADTILYLPIYCLEHVNRPPGIEIELNPAPNGSFGTKDSAAQLGDDGAYEKLQRGEVDLCVCDPMVILDEYKMRSPTIGVLVASLVTSPGLWALTTPSLNLQIDAGKSLLDQLKRSNHRLKTILTYDTASSASHVVSYLIKKELLLVEGGLSAREQCKFGEELGYINPPLPLLSVRPELIVTCDLVGALAAQAKASVIAPECADRIVLTRFSEEPRIRSALFTGLIAHRSFLRNNRETVIKIVVAIQEVLSSFHESDHHRSNMAAMITGKEHFFPSLKLFDCGDVEQLRLCKEAMEILHKNSVLPKTVRVERAHWQRQAEIWELDDVAKGFSECTDRSIGSRAYPSWLLRHTRRLRRHVLPILFPLALIVETFHGFAGFYHLYDKKPNIKFWLLWGATVTILFLSAWLFGVREGRGGE